VAQLGCAVLIFAALLDTRAANADDCACTNVPALHAKPSSLTASPKSSQQRPKTKRNFDLRLMGAQANDETNSGSLKAGETSRKYIGVELGGNLGSIVKTDVQVRFTEAQSDPGKAMLDLQPASQSPDARRALQDFFATSSFLGDRLTLSSYERTATFALIDAAGNDTKGEVQQHHISAALWHSDRADLDFDAALSRTSANYWDFGDSPDADLHANNSQVSQYRSKFRLDRFGLALFHRDTSTLVAPAGESELSHSETDAKLSLNIADLRDDFGFSPRYSGLVPLPDSIWVGTNNGALTEDDSSQIVHQAISKVSLGVSRNFGIGSLNASYWQSLARAARDAPIGYRQTGRGVDLGSNLSLGTLKLTGNVSLVTGQSFSTGDDTTLSTLGCSIFVTWQAPLRVDIKAGVTTDSFENEFADYDRFERNNSFRYQLALDLSQWASETLPQRHMQLKLLASFQGNQSNFVNSAGDVFTGLQLALPIHP
jgi:hypothetical protein